MLRRQCFQSSKSKSFLRVLRKDEDSHTVDTEKLMALEDPVLKFRYGTRHFVSDIHCKRWTNNNRLGHLTNQSRVINYNRLSQQTNQNRLE